MKQCNVNSARYIFVTIKASECIHKQKSNMPLAFRILFIPADVIVFLLQQHLQLLKRKPRATLLLYKNVKNLKRKNNKLALFP